MLDNIKIGILRPEIKFIFLTLFEVIFFRNASCLLLLVRDRDLRCPPWCIIITFNSFTGCKTELSMMNAGTRNSLQQELGLTKV